MRCRFWLSARIDQLKTLHQIKTMSDPSQKPSSMDQIVLYRMTSMEEALRELTQLAGG